MSRLSRPSGYAARYMGQSKAALIALTLAGLVAACSSESSDTPSRGCADGEITLCQHPSGCAASKTCDNEVFGPCVCSGGGGGTGATAAGGSHTGGSSGAAGSSGGGGAAGGGGASGGGGSGGAAGSASGGAAGAGGAPCGTTQKLCGAGCVDLNLPEFGCAAPSCDPCLDVASGSATCTEGLCDIKCTTSLSLCDVECVDLDADPTNCGNCHHSCSAGQCVSGVCQPFAVAAPLEPLGIAADTTHIYWVDNLGGNISRALFGVAAQAEQVAGALSDPWDLALIDSDIYFIERRPLDGRVARVPKAGGVVIDVASNQDSPSTIAGDALGQFWGLEGAGTVNDAGGKSRLAANPQGIALDVDAVYYSAFDSGEVVVAQRDLDVATSFTIASGQISPTSIALSKRAVYWIQRSAGATGGVYFAAKWGGPATLFETVVSPYDLAVDSTHVYWVARDAGGVVQRRAIAGGAVETLASAQGSVHSLALTPTLVYWTVQAPGGGGPGAVRGVAK